MNFKKIIRCIIEVVLMLFGLIMSVGSLTSILNGNLLNSLETDIIYGIFLGPLPIGIGIWMLVVDMKIRRKQERRNFDSKFLELIQSKNGNFTIADIAMGMGITLDESQKIICDLCERDLAKRNLSNDDKGMVSYNFQGFDRKDESIIQNNVVETK